MEVLDIAVDVPLLMSHPKSALLGVLQLLEGWQSVIEDDITVEQFSGAMTNMVYRCGLMQGGKEVQVVLMRVHASSSELFDRQVEIQTFQAVSQAGLGPHLLLLFRNGRVEEFLSEHVTLAAADIHEPAVSAAIAATLATFHQKMSKAMAGSKDPAGAVQLWQRLRLWFDLAQQATSLSELQQLGMAGLEQEIKALEQQLTQQHPCWVALCHNDLQYGNIMVHVGAAAASADSAPAAVAAAAASADGSTGGSLAQQLQGLGLQDRPAAAGGADGLGPGVSPRQQLLQPAGAAAAAAQAAKAAGASMLAAGLSARQAAPESWASDDAASLSNVSVAGSTAPSVSGLSAVSVPNAAAATPPPAGAAPTAAVNAAAAAAPKSSKPTDCSASASSSSLQVLGRSPHRTVQLPDGSLVLPGMRARPRGQSPQPSRGKRPDPSGSSFTGSLGGISAQGSGQWGSTTAGEGRSTSVTSAAGAAGSAAGAAAVPQLQPPSAAAVLRHAGSSDGDLLLQLMPDDPEAVAEAGLTRRRRISHADSVSAANRRGGSGAGSGNESDSESSSSSSSSSSSATTSAADSAEAEDLLLVPQHLQRQRGQQQQQPGREPAAGELVAEGAAAVSRSARRYREVRRARRRPAEGLEFPTLITSDAGSDSYSDGSSDLEDDSPSGSPSARHSRGRSPPSRFSKPASAAGTSDAAAALGSAAVVSPVAAAVFAAAGSADGGPDGSASCVTFIDYEYSGFNPVAFDIANHWCEWAADYHTEEPHVLDFSRLPDPQQQLLFVESYLRALLGKLGIQVPAGSSAAAGGRDSNTGVGAASPEPDSLSSLAGYKLTAGLNPAGSSSRSEAAWSTLSSRGAGSVLSYPDTEAGWETASQSSVVTTRSNRTDMEEGPAAAAAAAPGAAAAPAGVDGGGPGTAAASVNAAGSAKLGPSSRDLQDIWCWLEHAAGVSSSGGSSSRQLGAAAWQQLVFKVVAAADAYMAASHLQWALWGVIQAKVSDVDFDFLGYGQQRWRMYLQTRPTALRK